jgi:gas vesicle protein
MRSQTKYKEIAMTQENNWENAQASSAVFFTGLVAGALIGTGLGILFAPRRGAELRGQMAESATNMGQTLSKTVDGWSDRGREVFDRARDLANRVSHEVDRVASDATKTFNKMVNVTSDVAAGAARDIDTHLGASRG